MSCRDGLSEVNLLISTAVPSKTLFTHLEDPTQKCLPIQDFLVISKLLIDLANMRVFDTLQLCLPSRAIEILLIDPRAKVFMSKCNVAVNMFLWIELSTPNVPNSQASTCQQNV